VALTWEQEWKAKLKWDTYDYIIGIHARTIPAMTKEEFQM